MKPKQEKIKEIFNKLYAWVPEGVPLKKISAVVYPKKDWGQVFTDGDEKQPFFSEAYLYNLLGKEDARTLLALIQQLSKTFEFE